MVLDKEKHSGAQDMALDLQIGRVISYGGKNPPLCDLDCIGGFIVLFVVQLLCLISFHFKKQQGLKKLLEKVFSMALVPFFLLIWFRNGKQSKMPMQVAQTL